MKLTYLLLAGAMVSGAALATSDIVENPVTENGIVKIEWKDPKSFGDVKAASDIQSRYEMRTFETLTKNLNKEAAKVLKPNQKLELQVTDLDLAGDVRPTFGATSSDIRVIKDIYPPRITFTYTVTQDGKVMMAGAEKLKDLGFMHSVGRINDKPTKYESKLLADWVNKTVAPQL
ncbi:MAG: hypothetical protein ACI8SK_001004 [Shewanella sp.]|jgi:hypothetical protein